MSSAMEMLLTSILALSVSLAHIIAMIRTKGPDGSRVGLRDTARWAMVGGLTFGSAGFIFEYPGAYTSVDRWLGVPNLAMLLSCASFLLCQALVSVWISVWPGTDLRTGQTVRSLWVGYAGVLVLLAVLFACGHHPVEAPLTFDTTYIHDPASALFISCYLAVFLFLPGWVWQALRTRYVRRLALGGGRRWLVHGLTCLEIAMWAATGYTAILALVPLCAGLGLPNPAWAPRVATAMASLSAVSACLGFTCKTWGLGWDRFLEAHFPGYEYRVAYRRQAPLHRLLHSAIPEEVRLPRGLNAARRHSRGALGNQVMQSIEAMGYLDEHLSLENAERADLIGRYVAAAIKISDAAAAQQAGVYPAVTGSMPQITDPVCLARIAALLPALRLVDDPTIFPTTLNLSTLGAMGGSTAASGQAGAPERLAKA